MVSNRPAIWIFVLSEKKSPIDRGIGCRSGDKADLWNSRAHLGCFFASAHYANSFSRDRANGFERLHYARPCFQLRRQFRTFQPDLVRVAEHDDVPRVDD